MTREAPTQLPKRKLESYRRAEIVAQASRRLMTSQHPIPQELWDLWSGAVCDWMMVTGKLKYATPKRRKVILHGRYASSGNKYSYRRVQSLLVLDPACPVRPWEQYTYLGG